LGKSTVVKFVSNAVAALAGNTRIVTSGQSHGVRPLIVDFFWSATFPMLRVAVTDFSLTDLPLFLATK